MHHTLGLWSAWRSLRCCARPPLCCCTLHLLCVAMCHPVDGHGTLLCGALCTSCGCVRTRHPPRCVLCAAHCLCCHCTPLCGCTCTPLCDCALHTPVWPCTTHSLCGRAPPTLCAALHRTPSVWLHTAHSSVTVRRTLTWLDAVLHVSVWWCTAHPCVAVHSTLSGL